MNAVAQKVIWQQTMNDEDSSWQTSIRARNTSTTNICTRRGIAPESFSRTTIPCSINSTTINSTVDTSPVDSGASRSSTSSASVVSGISDDFYPRGMAIAQPASRGGESSSNASSVCTNEDMTGFQGRRRSRVSMSTKEPVHEGAGTSGSNHQRSDRFLDHESGKASQRHKQDHEKNTILKKTGNIDARKSNGITPRRIVTKKSSSTTGLQKTETAPASGGSSGTNDYMSIVSTLKSSAPSTGDSRGQHQGVNIKDKRFPLYHDSDDDLKTRKNFGIKKEAQRTTSTRKKSS